ncbi:zinc transport system permease protein [Jannaschia pohangensis]|uniref:High-affinity zinc uptake system membrane protein ZnuB n=1 Tax=Jannaschia pohangensis TaxID=390807 RepID=A0A1I3NW12_9RHOB|nr:iron chelate uptake ABC transporter family permease subunit [Jannaschia pohangensis]SFJ13455.1 zinc transport system permease protein [Jannaschia pohangensis]
MLRALLGAIRTATGSAGLKVSHELHMVMAASDRVICLNGHVCCEGHPEHVTSAPEYRALIGTGTQGPSRSIVTNTVTIITTITTTQRPARDHPRQFLIRAALAGLGVALVALSFLPGVRVDLTSYLFGDIRAVGRIDFLVIWGGAAIVLALLAWRWSRLLTATLGPDVAHAAGIDPRRKKLVLTIALALVVAVAIKVVGALLIGALLLIPAATARHLSPTPEAMACLAATIGAAAALGGIWMSCPFDTPTGPSIVCIAALLFAGSLVIGSRHR